MAENVRPGEANRGRPSGLEESLPVIDLAEKGRGANGEIISLDRRLFMQFMAFGSCTNFPQLRDAMERTAPQMVLYEDMNDPQGIGILSWSEDPAYFVDTIRPFLNSQPFNSLKFRPEFTMVGRTYSLGYESDLDSVLLTRNVQRVCDPATPWAVWYPVRRSGAFEQESRDEQRRMLMEHGGIGHAYGKAGYATDIRLAGHGLNQDDNDFIVGLIGKELFPLSALVQHMRRTKQTSQFIQHMGPFFIGRAAWQPQIA